jgi:hypothetical protein
MYRHRRVCTTLGKFGIIGKILSLTELLVFSFCRQTTKLSIFFGRTSGCIFLGIMLRKNKKF